AGDDALRQRLLEKLSAPPVGGNWSMLVQTAQDSTADVQGAYGFPGPGGAATATVACTAATANRVPAAGTLNTVRAAIAAVFPGEENINVVGVTPQGVDVTVKLTLPAPIGAGGAGGGWTDPNTWPTEDVRITLWGSNIATISHVSNPPQVGNQIGLWDPSFTDPNTGAVGIMRGPFTVSNVIDVFGTYSIQVTGNFAGFGGTLAGTYISAWAQNIVQYASAIVAEIAKLGPGQITNQPELLPRAFRQPSTDVMFPSDLTVTMLAAALPKSSFPEIGNFDFGVTYLASTTTSVITPPIPDTSMDPPRIFVPSNLAFEAVSCRISEHPEGEVGRHEDPWRVHRRVGDRRRDHARGRACQVGDPEVEVADLREAALWQRRGEHRHGEVGREHHVGARLPERAREQLGLVRDLPGAQLRDLRDDGRGVLHDVLSPGADVGARQRAAEAGEVPGHLDRVGPEDIDHVRHGEGAAHDAHGAGVRVGEARIPEPDLVADLRRIRHVRDRRDVRAPERDPHVLGRPRVRVGPPAASATRSDGCRERELDGDVDPLRR